MFKFLKKIGGNLVEVKREDGITISIFKEFDKEWLKNSLIETQIENIKENKYISIKLDLLNFKIGLYDRISPKLIKQFHKSAEEVMNNVDITLLFEIKDQSIVQIPFVPVHTLLINSVSKKDYLNYFELDPSK